MYQNWRQAALAYYSFKEYEQFYPEIWRSIALSWKKMSEARILHVQMNHFMRGTLKWNQPLQTLYTFPSNTYPSLLSKTQHSCEQSEVMNIISCDLKCGFLTINIAFTVSYWNILNVPCFYRNCLENRKTELVLKI